MALVFNFSAVHLRSSDRLHGTAVAPTGCINIYHHRHRLSVCFVSLSPSAHSSCGSGTGCFFYGVGHFCSIVTSLDMLVRIRLRWCCASKSELIGVWWIRSSA